MLRYILYRTTVKGVTPQLCVEWTQAYKRGGRWMCWIQYNYTGNWACFIDCERARPVTKPPSVSMVSLKGGGGRMAHLSLDQCHTWLWRIKLALVRNNCNSNFQRYSVHVYLTEGRVRHGLVLFDMSYWPSVKLMWSFLWRRILCTLIYVLQMFGKQLSEVLDWFISKWTRCIISRSFKRRYDKMLLYIVRVHKPGMHKCLPWQQFQSDFVEKVFQVLSSRCNTNTHTVCAIGLLVLWIDRDLTTRSKLLWAEVFRSDAALAVPLV